MAKRIKKRAALQSAGTSSAEVAKPARKAKKGAAGAAAARAPTGKKRRKRLDPEEESDDEDEEDDEEESEAGSDVDLDFELTNPEENDYHAVSNMLKSGTWEFMELNFPELVDTLVNQGNIGTLVKSNAGAEEDNDACALLTALNLRQFAELSWPRDIAKALVTKAKKHADASVVSKLEALVDRPGAKGTGEVGLLLMERFVNLPLLLVPPLHKALIDDIEWSVTTPECPDDEKPFYKFAHFVCVARCVGTPAGGEAAASSTGGKKKAKRQVAAAESGGAGLTYPMAELETYVKHASFSFTFPMSGGGPEGASDMPRKKGGGQERRLVFAVTKQGLEAASAELTATWT